MLQQRRLVHCARIIPGERNMQKIDFKKLLGFETVAATVSNFDFRDETVGSKLGAKVGSIEPNAPARHRLSG